MIKKNNQLIVGILIGALLFGVIPVGATVQDYLLQKSTHKIIIDGEEFINNELPVLFMEPGYNYIPAATFREICKVMGISFEFVVEKGEIQIHTKKETSQTDITQKQIIGGDIITRTDDRNVFLINGMKYITLDGVSEYLENNNKNKPYNKHIYVGPFQDGTHKLYTLDKGEVKSIIDDIPIIRSSGEEFNSKERVYYGVVKLVEYDYFENTMIPLIKK